MPLLAGALCLSGCKNPSQTSGSPSGPSAAPANLAPPYTGSDILLGEYGSMSGGTATFGKSTHQGITLAVEQANARGGVLGKKVRVQLEDDQGQPEQAATVVKKLIDQDNVLAVLGEVASSRSLAAAPICQAAGVPMISPTSTNPDVTKQGDYIFRTCFIDPFQGTVCARFALNHLHLTKAAILTDIKNDYSVGLTKYFKEEFERGGGTIVAEENYSEGDSDFRPQLTSIKGKNPQVLFVPGYYTEVGNIAQQADASELHVPLLGGDGWDSPKLLEIGKQAVVGSYFSTHYSPESKDPRVVQFVATYQKRFSQVPDALAAVAYDAGRLMMDAIKRAGSLDRVKIRDAIAATKNFPGVTGNITIDKDRNAVKPAVMLRVTAAGFKYLATVNP